MVKKKDEVSARELVKRLTERLGTDVDGLVPTAKKFLREKEAALLKSD